MRLYFLPSLIGLAVNISIGFYVLLKNPKENLNRSYFFLCFFFAVWALGDCLQNIVRGPEAVRLAADLRILGLSFIPPAFCRFALIFSDKKDVLSRKITLVWLYLPSIILTLTTTFTDLIFRGSIKAYFGYIPGAGPLLPLYLLWAAVYYTIGFCIILKFYRQTSDWRKKKIAIFFIIGTLIIFIFGFTIDGILALFKILFFTQVSIVASLVLVALVAYGIVRYGFFAVTPQLAALTIVENMPDFMAVLDGDLNVNLVNSKVFKNIGYESGELEGKPYRALFGDPAGTMEAAMRRGEPLDNYEAELLAKNGEKIPVSVNSRLLAADKSDAFGTVVISRDLRGIKEIIAQLEGVGAAVQGKNKDLENSNRQLKEKYGEIERINKLFAGREAKLAELEKEAAELRAAAAS